MFQPYFSIKKTSKRWTPRNPSVWSEDRKTDWITRLESFGGGDWSSIMTLSRICCGR